MIFNFDAISINFTNRQKGVYVPSSSLADSHTGAHVDSICAPPGRFSPRPIGNFREIMPPCGLIKCRALLEWRCFRDASNQTEYEEYECLVRNNARRD